MTETLYWFEIPVAEMARACRFYGALLDVDLTATEAMDNLVAFLPNRDGALVQGPDYQPGSNGQGVRIYLHCEPDLTAALERALAHGGTGVMPKTPIGPNGYVAYVVDSEGNKIGLHSSQ